MYSVKKLLLRIFVKKIENWHVLWSTPKNICDLFQHTRKKTLLSDEIYIGMSANIQVNFAIFSQFFRAPFCRFVIYFSEALLCASGHNTVIFGSNLDWLLMFRSSKAKFSVSSYNFELVSGLFLSMAFQ